MPIERGWRAKARYRIDEFIGGGAGKQLLFLALLTLALVVIFTFVGLVIGVGTEEGFGGTVVERVYETAWFYFARVIDSGTFTGDGGIVNRAVSTVVSILVALRASTSFSSSERPSAAAICSNA